MIELYGQFGHHLGMAIQMCDDLMGIWSPGNRRGGLVVGKRTLPVAKALSVASPQVQDRLVHYLQLAPHDPDAEASARQLMEEAGAAFPQVSSFREDELLLVSQIARSRSLRSFCCEDS